MKLFRLFPSLDINWEICFDDKLLIQLSSLSPEGCYIDPVLGADSVVLASSGSYVKVCWPLFSYCY